MNPRTFSRREFSWSFRILILALAGILLLTLYPFGFVFHGTFYAGRSPFLLGGSGKSYGSLDAFLNVLLFVPFGFGLAGLARGKGRSLIGRALLAVAAGALLSYSIEFLQFFIPQRDSGWQDVVTNSTGAVAGFTIFEICGIPLLRLFAKAEDSVEALATIKNVGIVLLVYFGIWLAVSADLQREMRLSNWQPNAFLVVGNSHRQNRAGWSGDVYQLEFWDRALPTWMAQQLTASHDAKTLSSTSLVAYDFSDLPPFRDERHFLPELYSAPSRRGAPDPVGVASAGPSWVATRQPVSALVADLQKTGKFSVLLKCKPVQVAGAWGPIVSISQPGGVPDLEIRQEESGVAFWFRTPLAVRSPRLGAHFLNVFEPDMPRTLLFSYDGARLALIMDGKPMKITYWVGPATALAQFVKRPKDVELRGYRYVFYSLVFCPAGCVLGFGWRKFPERGVPALAILLTGLFLPPVLFEVILAHVGGLTISLGNVMLAFGLGCAAAVWINLGQDGKRGRLPSESETRQ